MPSLSIITVCYNEKDLDKTCKSIFDQTNKDFDWIVIDGGSDAPYQEIFEKYKSRMKYFISEKDNGIYDAYNKGLKLADSDYILFINAGDFLYSDSTIDDALKNNDFNTDIVFGRIMTDRLSPIISDDIINKKFFITSCLPIPATFFKLDLFKKYGEFSNDFKIVSDLERLIVFCFAGASFHQIQDIITVFNQEGISSNKKFKESHIKERQVLLKKYYSDKEIKEVEDNQKLKLTFWQKLFSMKNTGNNKYKHITILGMTYTIKKYKD